MEDKLQEAKELLWANGYRTIKMTKEMNKDADECDSLCGDKDCTGCSCSICIME